MQTKNPSYSESKKTLVLCLTLLTVVLGNVACNRDFPPDPVKRQDGFAVIPFDGTVWVIPEKTWLKGYGRSVDGTVAHISLHAKAPEIAPWSEALHKTMYPEIGWGEITWIDLSERDTDVVGRLTKSPPTLAGVPLIKSDEQQYEIYGLTKYHQEEPYSFEYFVHVRDQKVTYLVSCPRDSPAPFPSCSLYFPWRAHIEVKLTFPQVYLKQSVEMADRVAKKLSEFEAAGEQIKP